MCSRFSQTKEKVTLQIYGVQIAFGFVPRYNIAPSQKVSVIVERAGKIQPVEMTWGWKPVWSKQLLINAQAETVTEKPTFKKILHQRCLVPADGFYEWTPDKSPIRFTKPRDELFCMAGLWLETTRQELDEPISERKFIILTTTPNKTVGRVHNRMPLIVQPEHYGWWIASDGLFESVLNCPDKKELNWQPVNRALNNFGRPDRS
jgi:putative SOS response-associated peptidase YedK